MPFICHSPPPSSTSAGGWTERAPQRPIKQFSVGGVAFKIGQRVLGRVVKIEIIAGDWQVSIDIGFGQRADFWFEPNYGQVVKKDDFVSAEIDQEIKETDDGYRVKLCRSFVYFSDQEIEEKSFAELQVEKEELEALTASKTIVQGKVVRKKTGELRIRTSSGREGVLEKNEKGLTVGATVSAVIKDVIFDWDDGLMIIFEET